MTAKRRPYKTYSKEFKLEAVRRMEASDRSAAEIARELGLRRNQLYKWKEQLDKSGDVASSKRGRPKKEDQSDVARLEAEVRKLREENEILKKAAVGSLPRNWIEVRIYPRTQQRTQGSQALRSTGSVLQRLLRLAGST